MASEQKVPYQTLINAYLRKELDKAVEPSKRDGKAFKFVDNVCTIEI